MFQYIWVVIIISNALLFNGNDWFKTFVWPLHHLVCFTLSPASPMRPTMPTTILVLGHIEKSKQNLDNLKQTQAKKTKNKTFERMFGFDSKDVCFGCPYIVFWFWNGNTKKNIIFLNGYDQSRCKNNSSCFLFFQHFRFGFLHWQVSNTKKWVFLWYPDWSYPFKTLKQPKVFCFSISKPKNPRKTKKQSFESKPNILSKVFLFFLTDFFVFFGLSIDSHDCHVCPSACLPYWSWEVKLWPKFPTQELAHYVRLSLA